MTDGTNWKLVWSDEFDAAVGSAPDPRRWGYDLGGHGWGNRELQTYTDLVENASIAADPLAGNGTALSIKALKNPDGSFTSARLTTHDTFQTTYGRFEARIKMPVGQGIWPAFWLLGGNMGVVGWPRCGEIDVMEWIGRMPGTAYGTLHGPGYNGARGIQGAYPPSGELDFSTAYHVFSVDWSPSIIEWHVDGNLYHALTPAELPSEAQWVLDHAFYLILNLAVGGAWPGYPDESTSFPQTLSVDYVRVYQSQ